jgi:hypothetical protein
MVRILHSFFTPLAGVRVWVVVRKLASSLCAVFQSNSRVKFSGEDSSSSRRRSSVCNGKVVGMAQIDIGGKFHLHANNWEEGVSISASLAPLLLR